MKNVYSFVVSTITETIDKNKYKFSEKKISQRFGFKRHESRITIKVNEKNSKNFANIRQISWTKSRSSSSSSTHGKYFSFCLLKLFPLLGGSSVLILASHIRIFRSFIGFLSCVRSWCTRLKPVSVDNVTNWKRIWYMWFPNPTFFWFRFCVYGQPKGAKSNTYLQTECYGRQSQPMKKIESEWSYFLIWPILIISLYTFKTRRQRFCEKCTIDNFNREQYINTHAVRSAEFTAKRMFYVSACDQIKLKINNK